MRCIQTRRSAALSDWSNDRSSASSPSAALAENPYTDAAESADAVVTAATPAHIPHMAHDRAWTSDIISDAACLRFHDGGPEGAAAIGLRAAEVITVF